MGDTIGEYDTTTSARAETLDAQHEELAALTAKIIERDTRGASKAELSLLLRQLAVHTERHFRDEEQHMRATGYGRLDTHQIMHGNLVAGLREHVAAFEAGDGKLGSRLITFLKFWLIAHINGMDRDVTRRTVAVPVSTLRPARKH